MGLTRSGGNKHEGPSDRATKADLLSESADVEVCRRRARSNDSLRVETGRLVEQEEDVTREINQRLFHEQLAERPTDEQENPQAESADGTQRWARSEK